MLNPTLELKAGSQVQSHAIVLSVLPLREADKLVHLLTPNWGIVTAVAPSAARSQKRFGAALEALNHVKAFLQVPRDPQSQEAPLWRLGQAELRDSFLHFRKSYELLESGFFVLRLVKDLLPETSGDIFVFRAVGRFLRDSAEQSLEEFPTWARLAFWAWFTHHLGFGDLSQVLEADEGAVGEFFREPSFADVWNRSLAHHEPQFGPLFWALKKLKAPELSPALEAKIYLKWVDLSGIHWKYFEQWLSAKIPS